MSRDRLRIEREIYARVVAAMDYPEPSALVQRIGGAGSRRLSTRDLVERWNRALDGVGDDDRVNLYVHVPYCKSICDFCNYKRLRVSSRDNLDEFSSFIVSEARLFAPAFERVRFSGLYVGGGTPSVLAADQLERVFDGLMSSFRFHPGAQKTFEFDPMVMTEDRYRVVQKYGFTRFSFGIQSVDVDVNRLHNRGSQNRAHLDKQFGLLAEYRGEHTNVDFLLGLTGTTPEQMLREIEQVMTDFQPNGVSIYFIYPTEEYLSSHFDGDVARYNAFLEPFERVVPPVVDELAKRLGYRRGGDGRHVITLHSLRPTRTGSGEDSSGHFYCDTPSHVHRPLYLLGLGDSSRSRIFGDLLYRAEHEHDDCAPGADRYVGVNITKSDEMFAYAAMVLRGGNRLSRSLFQRTFGVDPLDAFQRPIQKLTELGVAVADDEALELQPQARDARLRDLLFFLPPERRDALGDVSALGI
jgi:coproporphyrinogen III oxidase-like Fe-S oxidoreductase